MRDVWLSMLLSALPVILSTISSLYVPFHSMYKIASESHHGYGRSDYEDEDYDGYDRWDSEFRRRRRPSKRPRVSWGHLLQRLLDRCVISE